MKYSLYTLLLLLLLSCGSDSKLTFENVSFTNTDCTDCPLVDIRLPQVIEKRKIGRTINSTLQEEVIELLSYDEDQSVKDISGAISSFNGGYQDVREMFPDESIAWEAKIKGEVIFENKDLISIRLVAYIFTGGAHGFGSTRFLNFDKGSGNELERNDLFKDRQKLEEIAENRFRIQENIPQNAPINSTGFMFETDSFYLPENIGFTEEGLQLLYNPYEVASYADGTIELLIPYAEVNSCLVVPIGS